MRYRLSALLGLAGFLLASPVFGADTYAIDPNHTHAGFSVQHLVISHVNGNFTDVSGTIGYDESDLAKSSVNVTIKTASINTSNAKRDQHLKSPDFFDAEKYPEITFQSTRIEKKGDSWICVGNLTMHGVTKEVAIPFEVTGKIKDPMGKIRIAVEAGLTLNRQEFGVSWNKTLDNGGLMVGNDVKINLTVEATQETKA